jgi:hypothetical protein
MQIKIREVVEQITEAAVKNQSNPLIRRIVVPPMEIGQHYRQGDLYIVRVSPTLKVGKELERRQLADGESIGQRHVLLGSFKIYETVKQGEYKLSDLNARGGMVGYTFDIIPNGEKYPCINAHPEHSHYYFSESHAGRYQVVHQVDMQTLKKVED